jgi:hypothetical protein
MVWKILLLDVVVVNSSLRLFDRLPMSLLVNWSVISERLPATTSWPHRVVVLVVEWRPVLVDENDSDSFDHAYRSTPRGTMVPMVANQFLPETTLETSHDCCWLQKNRYLPPPWDAVVVVVVHAGSMRMWRHTNVPWCYICVRAVVVSCSTTLLSEIVSTFSLGAFVDCHQPEPHHEQK